MSKKKKNFLDYYTLFLFFRLQKYVFFLSSSFFYIIIYAKNTFIISYYND